MDAHNATTVRQGPLRRELLESLLGQVCEGVVIRPPFHVAPITIGDDVQMGPHVQLLTPTHPVDAELRRATWEAAEPITIGANTVVGAGAVVTKDLPAGVVAVGNPARVVRTLT